MNLLIFINKKNMSYSKILYIILYLFFLILLFDCFDNNDTINFKKNTVNYPHSVCQDIGWDPSDQIDNIISLMHNAGVESIRMPFRWSMIEIAKNDYVWTIHDPIVQKLIENNIKIVGQIISVPSWANGKTYDPNCPDVWPDCFPPDKTSDLYDYTNKLADHYKGKIKEWIVFNEPNLDVFWRPCVNVEEYVKFLKIAYTAIKASDSSNVVIAAGLAGNGIFMGWEPANSQNFLQHMYDNGAKNYFDVISIHPYLPPPQGISVLQGYINETLNVIKNNGDSVKLWIDEIGWASTRKVDGEIVPIDDIASWLTDIYTKVEGVDRIFWYNFKDVGADPNNIEYNFGLIDYNLNIKPTYTAFKNL